MRISDWSSDVCSSDLHAPSVGLQAPLQRFERAGDLQVQWPALAGIVLLALRGQAGPAVAPPLFGAHGHGRLRRREALEQRVDRARRMPQRRGQEGDVRSEEHTSELQSLMRSSYAIFCFQTKKKKETNTKYAT